jgi:7-cyano-7-deazaguanine synthase
MTKKAVVLTSGGLDSTTCIGIARDQGFTPIAISFAYGQRHAIELEAARRVVAHYGVDQHLEVQMPVFREIGGSALTSSLEVPKHGADEELGDEIPVTYVPARNLVFLSQAVALAEVTGAEDMFIGVNAVDYSGYPDCRPEFIQAFETVARLATKAGVESNEGLKVHIPLISLTKAEIIQRGVELDVPYHLTHSCYDPVGELSCGCCDSCLLRLKGFEEAGLEDPIRYVDAS